MTGRPGRVEMEHVAVGRGRSRDAKGAWEGGFWWAILFKQRRSSRGGQFLSVQLRRPLDGALGSAIGKRMFRLHNPVNRFHGVSVEWDEPPLPAKLVLRDEDAKTILQHNDSPDIGFDWSLSPYRGCTHACIFCYSRARLAGPRPPVGCRYCRRLTWVLARAGRTPPPGAPDVPRRDGRGPVLRRWRRGCPRSVGAARTSAPGPASVGWR